jgi:crotonobetainyl-CoA:carnitine CoA-transferase CaiB-like acyl-CoA transferase
MLQGLLVVDLTNYLPGPYATQVLADHGARVIKVEPPGGDPARHVPPHDADGVSATFRSLNHGKQSLALDLKHPKGRAILAQLIAQADVLAEGFRPGVLARLLGRGPEELLAAHPRLVGCSITGFGQDGPYRDKAGHDLNYLGYAGALAISTDREGVSVPHGVQVADTLASLAAVSGILMALFARERTSRGRWVDASMLDAAVSVQGLHLVAHAQGQPARARAMPLNGGFPCYDAYATQDGRTLALGALEPKFWAAFCDIVDEPGWVSRQFDPTLRGEVAAKIASQPRDVWRVALENADCCVTPGLTYDEMLEDPQVVARGLVRRDAGGQVTGTAPPMRFLEPGASAGEPGAEGPAATGSAPFPTRVGEHSRPLLGELLGMTPEEVDRLAAEGAVVTA